MVTPALALRSGHDEDAYTSGGGCDAYGDSECKVILRKKGSREVMRLPLVSQDSRTISTRALTVMDEGALRVNASCLFAPSSLTNGQHIRHIAHFPRLVVTRSRCSCTRRTLNHPHLLDHCCLRQSNCSRVRDGHLCRSGMQEARPLRMTEAMAQICWWKRGVT